MQREADLRGQYTMWFVLVLTGLLLLACGGCSHPPDEVRIREAIEAMRLAAEARDAAGVLDGIAGDFTGQNGELDRDGLARIVKIELLRGDAIGVSLGPIGIVIDGERATAKFEMTLSDRSRRWLPSGSETDGVVSGWRRNGGRWVCYNATWTARE
jgi:hypothetical protein